MHKREKLKHLTSIIIFAFICAACSQRPVLASPTSTNIVTLSSLPATSTSTLRPSKTSTSTGTATLQPTSTPMPVPTLSLEEIYQVEDFLHGTEDCQLPCWNGITPGISGSKEAMVPFARLGIDIQELQPYTRESGRYSITEFFLLKDYKKPTEYLSGVYVEWSDLQVKVIGLFYFGAFPEFFSIDGLLNKFGTSPEVQLNIAGTEGGPRYLIYMNFPDKNVTVVVESTWNYTNEICSLEDEIETIEVFAYAPGINIDDYALTSKLWADPEHYTGLSKEVFLQKLRNLNTCIPFEL